MAFLPIQLQKGTGVLQDLFPALDLGEELGNLGLDARIVARLRTAGATADRPCAIIEQATLPGQRVLRSDLARIAELAGRERVAPPALLVVGAVAALGHQCAPVGATNGGPVNSVSIEKSITSPTPTVVPGAGTPNEIPKSERLNDPCAENPTRACGSMFGIPA